MELTAPLAQVKYIGKARADLLAQKGLNTVYDLLNAFPYAYEDTTNILSIKELYNSWQTLPVWEAAAQRFTVKGKVHGLTTFRSRRGMTIVKATIIEATDSETVLTSPDDKLDLVWFNQPYVARSLKRDGEYLFFGKVSTVGGKLSMQAPRFEEVVIGEPGVHIGRITPLYHQIKGVTAAYFRRFFSGLRSTIQEIPEYLPVEILQTYELEGLPSSYEKVHFPVTMDDGEIGRRRLAIQELLELKDELEQQKRHSSKSKARSAAALELSKKLAQHIGKFLPKLPFVLTAGQQNILAHILEKISQGVQLDTFLYGDVGSGKTIIALLLASAYVLEGQSSILMVPTTILANQHVETANKICLMLGLSEGTVIPVVSGVKKVKTDEPAIYIGTQAILHNVSLRKHPALALVVIDEQHRFGVDQRQYLYSLPDSPHMLTLSATPIPRTLALSFIGFSDAEFLKEKPVGRMSVITKVVPQDKGDEAYEWIKKRVVDHQEQAFLVFPRIYQSEDESDKQSLLTMKKSLEEKYFNDIPMGLLYGSLSEKEKQAVMTDFREGKTKLLFSTTVVEVGVDIPQATVMAIHGADMYGMAQLHQLRGRVGRSDKQSYCLLFTHTAKDEATKRLQFFSEHTDGIDLAEYDMQYRGSGHLGGAVQAGASDLLVADLTDLNTLQQAVALFDELSARKCRIPRILRVQSADGK